MLAKVICVASAKGGSGKTIITAGFSHFLASMDKRVLLVDTDAATNGLSLFYLPELVAHRDRVLASLRDGPPAGIFDLARGKGQVSSVQLEPGIDFLPATYRAFNTENVPAEDFGVALQDTLTHVREKYDFILLDAQAGSDPIAQVSMSAKISDQVVLVSEYDPLSVAGIERLKSLFPDDLRYERTWILINKMLPEFASSLGDFLQVARYLSPIPWDADVVRAYAQRGLALDLTYGNDYTLAVISAAKGLLGPTVNTEIDKWIASRATALKAPVERQLQDLEVEAEGLVIEDLRYRRRITQVRFRRIGLFTGTVLVVVAATFAATQSPLVALVVFGVILGALLFTADDLAELDPMAASWRVRESELERQKLHLEERIKTLRALTETDPAELLESRTKIPKFKV